MKIKLALIFSAIILIANSPSSFAQLFTKVTATTNPIVTDPVQTSYAGANWIDLNKFLSTKLFIKK